jgi:hypothetical protein
MDRSVADLALRINRSLLKSYQEYLDECEATRRDGYRPHYCEHGTNQWTDYDNICGPCEDGQSMGDPFFRMRFAIDAAKDKMEAFRSLYSDAAKWATVCANHRMTFDWTEVHKRGSDIIASCDRY